MAGNRKQRRARAAIGLQTPQTKRRDAIGAIDAEREHDRQDAEELRALRAAVAAIDMNMGDATDPNQVRQLYAERQATIDDVLYRGTNVASPVELLPHEPSPLDKLAAHLAWVAEEYRIATTPEKQRDSMGQWIASHCDYLKAVGASYEQRMPGFLLAMDLTALDAGFQSPRLTKVKLTNRAGDPPMTWVVRACLAAAIEARTLAGEDVDTAAKTVARKFGSLATIRGAHSKSERTDADYLAAKRDEFKAGTAGSPDGNHRTIWQQWNLEFTAICKDVAINASEALLAYSHVAVEKALGFSGRALISE